MKGIKIVEAVGSSLPCCVREAVIFLRHGPRGEVYPVETVAERIRYARESFVRYTPHPALRDFRARRGSKYFYGSKAAIKKFRAAILRRQFDNR